MIVGICGGSGSGKTTLLRRLQEYFADLKPSVFSMDNYYFPIEEQIVDENGYVNFDLPTALDHKKMLEDLKALKEGKEITVREYHFNSPPDKHVLLTIAPSEIIIVEGLFLFEYKELSELLDFSIFIDVDPAIQLDRRLYRDQEARGYSREAILYQWENHVLPCYENYLLPYRKDADFHFNNNSLSNDNFDELVDELSKRVRIKASQD